MVVGKNTVSGGRANSACRHRSRSHNLPTRVIGDLGTRRTRQGISRIAKRASSFAVADYMSPWSLKEDPLVELYRSPDAQAAGKISFWLVHSSPRIKTFSDPVMSKIDARWEPLSREATPVTALRYFKQSTARHHLESVEDFTRILTISVNFCLILANVHNPVLHSTSYIGVSALVRLLPSADVLAFLTQRTLGRDQ